MAAGDPAVRLLAGTSWLWAREDMHEAVDVLFVDEAGQVSLADAVAMSGGTRSLVLLGDPQQLPHVSQGMHPRGSGVSVLEHALDGHDTVPAGSRRVPRPHVAHAPGDHAAGSRARCTTAGCRRSTTARARASTAPPACA